MRDTIYRESAIDTLDKHLRMTDVPVSYPGIISALTEWLNELPSAKLEIVRCKDCKHVRRWRSKEAELKFGQVYDCAYGVFLAPRAEDFCSHAERRSDD